MPGGHENYYYRLEDFCVTKLLHYENWEMPLATHLMDNKILFFSLMKIQDWLKVSDLFHSDIIQRVCG